MEFKIKMVQEQWIPTAKDEVFIGLCYHLVRVITVLWVESTEGISPARGDKKIFSQLR